jgi:hypothetical protein
MPLLRGKRNIGANITELEDSGHFPDPKQRLAIALRKAGVPKPKPKTLRERAQEAVARRKGVMK